MTPAAESANIAPGRHPPAAATEINMADTSVGNLDSLDDLGSLDSAAPSSPPRVPYYNPIGLTIGENNSPSSPRQIATASHFVYQQHPGSNTSHTVNNAVHMHVQENAKVSTYMENVNRTNSSQVRDHMDLMTMQQLDDQEFSMAELFLSKESSQRRSLDQNYEGLGLGSILSEVGFGFGVKRRPSADGSSSMKQNDDNALDSIDEDQMEIDALTAAIDPTPLSEIKRKLHDTDSSEAKEQTAATIIPNPQPNYSNSYRYGRHQPLPIPRRAKSPAQTTTTTTTTMAQALATAAEIASRRHLPPTGTIKPSTTTASTTTTTIIPSSLNKGAPRFPAPAPVPRPPAMPATMSPPPYTKAQQTTAYQRHQRATYTPPQHAVTHSKSRASVVAATKQKSQYGFGGNHMIPSVPAPPLMAKTFVASTHLASIKAGGTGGPPPTTTTIGGGGGFPLMPHLPIAITASSAGAAYERKKQRAKDARIKLNDAIESLALGMSLAGSQSKLRSAQLRNIATTESRPKTLHAMEECTKAAESAKKWDRPSFVSTAAAVVQGLNSQCDLLVREVTNLQERLDALLGNTAPASSSTSTPMKADMEMGSESSTSHPEHKRHGAPELTQNDDMDEELLHTTKRMRAIEVDDDNEQSENGRGASIALSPPTIHVEQGEATDDENIIFEKVSNMLDPVSLSRCPSVSRNWRDMGAFDKDQTWLDLAIRRFGLYNVRQWTEILEDNEGGDKTVPKRTLYQSMNAANVMPHIQQEHVSSLGEAKISGRVSAWVFMVERSNGETLRSVKREPEGSSGRGNGSYASLHVVELRIIIQNIGMGTGPVILKDQNVIVDTSTRRSGGELSEITWDDRLAKLVKNLDGTVRPRPPKQSGYDARGELCQLGLFDTVMLEVHIHARGCSTMSKFEQRSNFTKVLVCLDGTTVPLVIPFLRNSSHVS
jgi:hypothetical protein